MALVSKKEAKEWESLRAKSRRHGVSVQRVAPALVVFLPSKKLNIKKKLYAQLGTGRATEIMDARVQVGKHLRGFYPRK